MLMANASTNYLDLGGTFRSVSVLETIRKLEPLLTKIGITRVANITGLDTVGIPTAVSIRPFAKHLSVSQGKGLTWELAYISAVMESIEGYHAENPRDPQFYGSYTELSKSYSSANPNLFNSGFFHLESLENLSLGWIEGTELVSQKSILLPHVIVCLDSTQPHPEYGFLSVSSNGLAAGNSLEEAICHGMYEIIERDCLYRWAALSEKERIETQIKLETIDSPINQTLLSHYTAANIKVKVWDITSSLGVPGFHCVIQDSNVLRRLGMFRGTGTHLSKEIALSRALTEAAQSRLTLISGSRDDVFLDHYQQRSTFSYSLADYQGKKDFKLCYQPDFENSFSANINQLIHSLSQQNYSQVFMVNHTKPDLGIPVVHLFIPGMQFNGTRI